MKTFIDCLKHQARRLVKPLTCTVLVGGSLLLAVPPARAQLGTYVTTRPVVLQVGTLTNVQASAAVVFTNYLNYSGFHRVGFWLTLVNTNAAGAYSNIVVNVSPTFGSGNGYTNALLGTNLVYTTSPAWTWTNAVPPLSTNVLFTNLDWQLGDTVAGWQVAVSTTSTNALPFKYQIDGVVTP